MLLEMVAQSLKAADRGETLKFELRPPPPTNHILLTDSIGIIR